MLQVVGTFPLFLYDMEAELELKGHDITRVIGYQTNEANNTNKTSNERKCRIQVGS